MENFLKKLGIDYKGTRASDGCYIIDLDEDQWARCYSILDDSNLVEQDYDSSNISYDASTIQYESDDYIITLIGDYGDINTSDTFRLTIKNK